MRTVIRVRSLACWYRVALFGLLIGWTPPVLANPTATNIFSRPELSPARRADLTTKLRAITGWAELGFDAAGGLRTGRAQSTGGSAAARALLAAAMLGQKVVLLEDASNRPDVVFCRVVAGKWAENAAGKPPVYVLLIDFGDFDHVMGDKAALAAFNVGWGVLHELAHVVHDASDATNQGDVGECEGLINQMRRECGLAERAEYFFTYLPGTESSEFKTKFVRLAFELRGVKGKKRYWLFWDATLTGGVFASSQIATR